MNNALSKHRLVWQNKKILRDIYTDWYQMICQELAPGKTLELGSGSGNFKEFKPDIISSDIDPQPWLDMHFDAHHIPLDDNSLSNIVMVDVLHHLSNPIGFFNEAYRVLKNNGRIVMIEPYPSTFSSIVYRLFHPEPFIYDVDYFITNKPTAKKLPWESNQAIPFLIFFKNKARFLEKYSRKFTIIKTKKFSFVLYPLSGGFENKQLIPNALIPFLKLLEILLTPLRRYLAFRCLIVIEKQSQPSS